MYKSPEKLSRCCMFCKKEMTTSSTGFGLHLRSCKPYCSLIGIPVLNTWSRVTIEQRRIAALRLHRTVLSKKLKGRDFKTYCMEEIFVRNRYYKGPKLKSLLVEFGFCKDESCSKCGWNLINPVTKSSTTEVHHKNGDSSDNRVENLDILCLNCHSLTTNYKNVTRNAPVAQLDRADDF